MCIEFSISFVQACLFLSETPSMNGACICSFSLVLCSLYCVFNPSSCSTHTPLPLLSLQKWLEGVVVTKEKLEVAKSVCDAHLGPGIFNYDGWSYILEQHGGRLPLRIRAVPEGSVIPFRNGMPISQRLIGDTPMMRFMRITHTEVFTSN